MKSLLLSLSLLSLVGSIAVSTKVVADDEAGLYTACFMNVQPYVDRKHYLYSEATLIREGATNTGTVVSSMSAFEFDQYKKLALKNLAQEAVERRLLRSGGYRNPQEQFYNCFEPQANKADIDLIIEEKKKEYSAQGFRLVKVNIQK